MAQETVVLVHGILVGGWCLARIRWELDRVGFKAIVWNYPSTKKTIEEHAEDLHNFLITLKPEVPVHFVGFSMGALVVRQCLGSHPEFPAGRFVMIGPPNRGSELMDYLYRFAWVRLLFGDKAGPQLKASNREFYARLPAPRCEFGIIAGIKGDGKGYSRALPGDDDGAVSLESARLEGSKDFATVRGRHSVILFKRETSRQVVSFLQTARFQ